VNEYLLYNIHSKSVLIVAVVNLWLWGYPSLNIEPVTIDRCSMPKIYSGLQGSFIVYYVNS